LESDLSIREPDLRDTPLVEYRLVENNDLDNLLGFDLIAGFDEDGRAVLPKEDSPRFLVRVRGRFT